MTDRIEDQGMDETRLRAVIREEIALAMKTLEDQAYSSDPEDDVSLERALSSFNSYAYEGACRAADEAREANPFEGPEAAQPHVHRFEYADDGNGHSGFVCNCGAEETGRDQVERRRIEHAAAYLPAVDLNRLDAGAYKLLGSLARSDPYTNAVIRLVQHGGPRTGR